MYVVWQNTKVDWGWVPDMLCALPALDHYLWTSIWKMDEYSLVKAMLFWIFCHPQPNLVLTHQLPCPWMFWSLCLEYPFLTFLLDNPYWSFKFLPKHHLLCHTFLGGINHFLLYDSFAPYIAGSNYWVLTVCQAPPWLLYMHSSFNPHGDIWDR